MNLLETLNFTSTALENGKPVDVIFLDFARAFDTVSHKRLLLKLTAYGISGLTIQWIEAFLKERKQRVVIGKNIYLLYILLDRNYQWHATRVSFWTTLVCTIYKRFA